jgi:hypothetical protein
MENGGVVRLIDRGKVPKIPCSKWRKAVKVIMLAGHPLFRKKEPFFLHLAECCKDGSLK